MFNRPPPLYGNLGADNRNKYPVYVSPALVLNYHKNHYTNTLASITEQKFAKQLGARSNGLISLVFPAQITFTSHKLECEN